MIRRLTSEIYIMSNTFQFSITTLGIQTLLVTLTVTNLPSAHVQRALPVYISVILI